MMSKMISVLCIALALVMLTSATLWGAENWWHNDWEYRIGISLQNISQVNLTAQPVIISGKDFLQKIGIKDSDESFNWPDEENKAAGISISSLRLVEKGNELPLQVDKRDSAGFFIKRAEDFLEQDDEIVFMVDIPAGQQANYYIYFSHKPKTAPNYKSDIRIQPLGSKNNLGTLQAGNSRLSFTIKGPRSDAALDPNKVSISNYCCGSMTQLRLLGEDAVYQMLYPTHRFDQIIPGTGGSKNIPFSLPQVVVDGPVRKVIEVTLVSQDDQNATSGNEHRETRYFSIYQGSGRIDFSNIFNYKVRPKYNPRYVAGGAFNMEHSLLVPIDGMLKEINISEIDLKKTGNQVYYTMDAPQEGWFAWLNRDNKIGMATFFDPTLFSAHILQRNPQDNLGKYWGSPDNRLTAVRDASWARLTFFAITSAQEVKPFYEFWKNSGITFMQIEKADS
ncbi:MAG: hypothetical protein ACOX1G_05820 [bacterium]|jgi:hypothetical protein